MITIASPYSPKVATPSRPYPMQLCRDAAPTLPIDQARLTTWITWST